MWLEPNRRANSRSRPRAPRSEEHKVGDAVPVALYEDAVIVESGSDELGLAVVPPAADVEGGDSGNVGFGVFGDVVVRHAVACHRLPYGAGSTGGGVYAGAGGRSTSGWRCTLAVAPRASSCRPRWLLRT